ncbi:MAG: hypothetical protein ABI702_25065 [Burkholderiales bacterium]
MRPVLVLQNLTSDGPGYLGLWLARQCVPFPVFNTEAGEQYPQRIDVYRALALLGGEMSANDDLPSLCQAEGLIVQAMQRNLPVIGHCLGGQLREQPTVHSGAAMQAEAAAALPAQQRLADRIYCRWLGGG